MKYHFRKSRRKGKKYDVTFTQGGKTHTVSFGGLGYDQYRDDVPLGLYSDRNHMSLARRKAYLDRHGRTGVKKYSAKYFSHVYLWAFRPKN